MSTGPVELQGITINAGILETLQGFSTQRNVLKGITIAVGTGASIMQLKVVDKNHEPIEGATCRVLNAISGSNNVLSFDGVDDYVQFTAVPFLLNYSLSAYIDFRNAASALRYLFGADATYRGIYYNATIGFTVYSGSSGYTYVAWPKGEWAHFVIQRTGTRHYKILIDGVEKGTIDSKNDNTININRIARGIDGLYFKGVFSDVRIYDHVMSASEITDAMSKRATGSETGLLHYWPLDEGQEATVENKTAANNGTIFGATWAEADESFPLYSSGVSYDTETPYDSQITNANGLTTLNYQINQIHGLEVTLPGKRRFIMPFERTQRGLLDWQVMLSDYLATFATDRGNILINSEPENNDANFLIE